MYLTVTFLNNMQLLFNFVYNSLTALFTMVTSHYILMLAFAILIVRRVINIFRRI